MLLPSSYIFSGKSTNLIIACLPSPREKGFNASTQIHCGIQFGGQLGTIEYSTIICEVGQDVVFMFFF